MNIELKNGVGISLVVKDGKFLGLGEITVADTALRCGRVPIAPLIETLDGLQYQNFVLIEQLEDNDEVILRCRAEGVPGNYTERTDLLHHRGMATYFPETRPVAEIDWILKPVDLEIGGRSFVGLSYRYVFRGPEGKDGQVHQIVDRASWEIGGTAEGNTIISVGQVNEPEHQATRSSAFDTRTAQRGANSKRKSAGGYVAHETSPRFGIMQFFDYLFTPSGALAVFYDRMEHIRGLVDKHADSDLIVHLDEISFPLSNQFETPAKLVLFHRCEQPLDMTDGRNIWTEVHDHVADIYRTQYGIRAEEPLPQFLYNFEYKPQLRAHVLPSDPENYYRRLGKELVPRAAAMGFKRFFVGPPWINDFTEEKLTHNCCVTLDYRMSDRLGGENALADLCQSADRAGMEILLWYGWSASLTSPLIEKHPEWRVFGANGALFNGGFSELCALDPRSGFRKYLTEQLVSLRRATGFHGVMNDSFINLPTLTVNYADPTLEPSLHALLATVVDLQREGLVVTVEGNGPFGLAVGCLPHQADGGPEVMLQWFFGREYALYNTNRAVAIEAVIDGILTPERYFRFLANKAPLRFDIDPTTVDQFDILEGEFSRLHKIYNQMQPLMRRRRLLHDDAGVQWEANEHEGVLFAFKLFQHALEEEWEAEEITEDGTIAMSVINGEFQTYAGGVYRLSRPAKS